MPRLTPVFVGIDVACAQRKKLPICFVTVNGRRVEVINVPAALARPFPVGAGNREILEKTPFRHAANSVAAALDEAARAERWDIVRIAVDAPSAPPVSGERRSEADLRRDGIPSFQTPDRDQWEKICKECRVFLQEDGPLNRLPCANKIWMLYGFELFRSLRGRRAHEVIEVYPHAIIAALLGECAHKSTPEGYRRQLEAIAVATGWEPGDLKNHLRKSVPGSSHDKLDAFMAAWIASLPPARRRAYGDKNNLDDAIWVPRPPAY